MTKVSGLLAFASPLFFSNLFAQPARNWGTYFGETGYEIGHSTAKDVSGNVYVAGITNSTTGISTVGSHQSTFGGGTYDAFLAKFNSAGVLQWATYYGGALVENNVSVAVDANGNIYLSGSTSSTASISTAGSHQPAYGGGGYDGFLVKFNSSGVRTWGTYYGGTNNDFASRFQALAVDSASGSVYIALYTTSTGMSTVGSHQAAIAGGQDACLVKFNSAGIRQWATYYGGTSSEYGNAVEVDENGNVYLTGQTTSSNAISTVGCHQPTLGGGQDAYLVKFNSAGVRQWGTYYGGTTNDDGFSVATDGSGNVYITGETTSSSGISTIGSHQPTYGGGSYDAYLVQFNNAGVRQWATYYGDLDTDNGEFVTTDGSGNVYITGSTRSTTAISTIGSHQPVNGGNADAFLVQFNILGTRTWGTYYGGTTSESGNSIAFDGIGNIYVVGYTSSTTAISTAGSHQPVYGGGTNDAFLVQFNGCVSPSQPGSITGNTTICASSSNTYSIASVAGATSYTWTLPGGWSGTSTTNSINATAGASGGTISVTANNSCGNSTAQTLNVTVNTAPATPGSISGSTTVCAGTLQPYSIGAVAGATSYTWTLPGGWSGTSTTNTINTTAGASGGTISVTANNSCGSSVAQTLNVIVNTVPVQPSSVTGNISVCEGSSQPYSVTNDVTATSYTWTLPATWSGSSTTNSINSTVGTAGGTISVTANNSCGSSASQTLNVTVNSLPTVTLSLNATSVCVDNAVFAFTGGSPAGGTFSGTGVTGGNFNAATAGAGTHTITYSFTDGNGCTNTNTDQVAVNNCTDISDFGSGISEVVIYPNPFTNEITISGNFNGSAQAIILNPLGEVVLSTQITSNVKLQTSNFSPGMYFLQIKNENTSVIKKIIKE